MNMPLVLLPGMMCDARLFAPQLAVLARDRDVIVPRLAWSDTIVGLADAVLAEAPRRFALAGLSMGGIVAMEIATRAPERVARLALLDTNPLAEPPEKQALRATQIDKVRAGGLREVMRDEMKPNYLADGPRKAEILDLCMDMALALGSEVFVSQSIALRDRPNQSAALRRLDMPTLILCGRHDTLCPVAWHDLLHDLIPGSRLEIIEDAGHLPSLEAPEQTTAALARWLEDT